MSIGRCPFPAVYTLPCRAKEPGCPSVPPKCRTGHSRIPVFTAHPSPHLSPAQREETETLLTNITTAAQKQAQGPRDSLDTPGSSILHSPECRVQCLLTTQSIRKWRNKNHCFVGPDSSQQRTGYGNGRERHLRPWPPLRIPAWTRCAPISFCLPWAPGPAEDPGAAC